MNTAIQDLRYALHAMRRAPGFSVIVVATLALGIGANTAIFSVVNSVLINPLAYKEPGRIVRIWDDNLEAALTHYPASAWNFLDWRAQNRVFARMAAWRTQSFAITGQTLPERIDAALVSPELFAILGVNPLLGRTFVSGEDRRGEDGVALLSYGFWQRHFGGDPNVVGETISLSQQPVTIIGVMPDYFRFPEPDTELWRPLVLEPSTMQPRIVHYLGVLAQLKPQASLESAQAEMTTIGARLAKLYPAANTNWSPSVKPLQEAVVGDVQPALLLLLAATGFVLLIACANVANLLLVRASARQREMAVRSVLGAGTIRLARQVVTESLLFFLLGGAVGLVAADGFLRLLVQMDPMELPRLEEIAMDGRVLGFTAALTLLAGTLFSLVPAFQSVKPNQQEALKAGGWGSSEGRGRKTRHGLVVIQVALALVLLVAGGLTIRSLHGLLQVDPGFDDEEVLTLKMDLDPGIYGAGRKALDFIQEILGGIQGLPGVQAAAVSSRVPQTGGRATIYFATEDLLPRPSSERPVATFYAVTPGYFHALGIPLLKGRAFAEQDDESTPKVAIISETLARQQFQGVDPIGRYVIIGKTRYEIVGVVGDTKYGPLHNQDDPQLYVALAQDLTDILTFMEFSIAAVVRAKADPAQLARSVREQIWAADRNQPVHDVTTLDRAILDGLSTLRANMVFFILAGAVALTLAAVGIYGVIDYSVSRRTRETGIRMALGATPGNVLGMIMRQGITLVVAGVLLGMAGAYVLTRFLGGVLFTIEPTDPTTFVGVSTLLISIALLATYIPARRATKVDPLVALRYE